MIEYTWAEFDRDCLVLGEKINHIGYGGLYGVPRGGVPLAVRLSSLTGKPLLEYPIEGCLVVDDIIDSGKTREKFKEYDFVSLHCKSIGDSLHHVEDWVKYPWETEQERNGEDIVLRMLEFIGENPNRTGLKDTPKRVVKMWGEVFRGYDKEQFPNVTIFPNGEDGIYYHDMIIDQGYFYSACEHHAIPFFGEFYFGYVPGDYIVGASKISRVVDYYSARLQVAERLVHDIAGYFDGNLKPKGLILIMKGRHLCKEMRGVKKYNSPFEVIAVRGCFADNDNNCKDEFLSRIK